MNMPQGAQQQQSPAAPPPRLHPARSAQRSAGAAALSGPPVRGTPAITGEGVRSTAQRMLQLRSGTVARVARTAIGALHAGWQAGTHRQDVALDVVAPVLNRHVGQALLEGEGHRLRDQLPRQRVLPLCKAPVWRQNARPVPDQCICTSSSARRLSVRDLSTMRSVYALNSMR